MANKKSSKKCKLNLWYLCATLLGVATLAMLAVSSVKIVGNISGYVHNTASGWQAAFGSDFFSFSFMNMLTYVLVLCATLLACCKAFGLAKGKVLDYVMIALFAVAGVFYFLAPNFAISDYAKTLGNTVSLKLAVGSILAACFSLLSACAITLKNFKD